VIDFGGGVKIQA